MSLSTYALVSLTELKDHLGISGAGKDIALEDVINRVTDEIEQYLDRQIVTRGSLTEYHTFSEDTCELRTLERPLTAVTTVHEDTSLPRTYAAATLLVSGTDYHAVNPAGVIRRINGAGLLRSWATGYRAIKVVYTAGYASTATVPARIKAIALRYAALIWDEQKRQAFGVSGVSDALGNYTRFASAQLNDEMRSALAAERRWSIWESGERDS